MAIKEHRHKNKKPDDLNDLTDSDFFSDAIDTVTGGVKKFAQMFIDNQKSAMAQYLAETGKNRYFDKLTGKELTPEEVYKAKQLNPLAELQPTSAAQQQGADIVEEHAATAAIIAAVSVAATKGRSAYKEFKNFNPKEFKNIFKQDIVDTSKALSLSQLKNIKFGKFNYIVTKDGNLSIVKVTAKSKYNAGYGHVDLANGENVVAAGEFRLKQGKIDYIDNSSGHFLPTGKSAQKAAEHAFKKVGYSVKHKYIEKMWNGSKWVPKR